MGRKQEKEIIKHITLEELTKIIKKEEKSVPRCSKWAWDKV
jgi:hypothetical protein